MMSAIRLLAVLTTLLGVAQGQGIGVTTCACQPATYTFQLHFNQTCADTDVKPGDPGIVDVACLMNPEGAENVTDLVPVRVTEVQILELDQNLQVVFMTHIKENLLDGDEFNYTSITRTMPDQLNATSVPKGIQVFLTGRNAEEQDVVLFWAIVYDNDCGIFPLLTVGERVGWTSFTNLGEPPQFLCPAVPASESPTVAPTTAVVTEAPTKGETTAPTSSPTTAVVTESPTAAPTSAPTASPTGAPTAPPTTAPSSAVVTESPTAAPTATPTATPTTAPTSAVVTEAPSLPETSEPTLTPTAKFVTTPTASPSAPGCPPVSHSGSSSARSGSSSSKGLRSRVRRLMVNGNTPAPTACPEPSSSSKGSIIPKASKKKHPESKRSKHGMSKLIKGSRIASSKGASSKGSASSKGGSSKGSTSSKGAVSDGLSSSSSSSKGGRRRFLMQQQL